MTKGPLSWSPFLRFMEVFVYCLNDFFVINLAPGSAPLISPFSCSVFIVWSAARGCLGKLCQAAFMWLVPVFIDSDIHRKNASAFLQRF